MFLLLLLGFIYLIQTTVVVIVYSFDDVSFLKSVTNDTRIKIFLPQAQPRKDDEYLCTATQVHTTTETLYIKEIEVNLTAGRTHHFLLYGCYKISNDLLQMGYWPCNTKGKGSCCNGRKQIPIGFKSISPDTKKIRLKYPSGVGYPIGSKFKINYVVLEIHYLKALPNGTTDSSGVTLFVSENKPNYVTGTLLFAAVGFRIPPGRDKFSVDINCKLPISQSIYPYNAWVHTHDIGTVVSAYVIQIHSHSSKNGSSKINTRIKELVRWTHRWPQPVPLHSNKQVTINVMDIVAAKCTYNSTGMSKFVQWGRKRSDEMCNLFVSYIAPISTTTADEISLSCVNEQSREITNMLPKTANMLPIPQPMKSLALARMHTDNDNPVCKVYRKLKISPCPFQ